jgi:hypothetical protein
MSGAKHTPGRVRVTMSHEEFQLLRAAPDLAKALLGLEYRKEPGVFCDHPAAPCSRCDAALAALTKAGLR